MCLTLSLSAGNHCQVTLNPDSASHPLVQFGEILKQVQDDKSGKFQISLVRSLIGGFHRCKHNHFQ